MAAEEGMGIRIRVADRVVMGGLAAGMVRGGMVEGEMVGAEGGGDRGFVKWGVVGEPGRLQIVILL
jgi:hypothetical protein